MGHVLSRSPALEEILERQSGVVDIASALRCVAPGVIRWRLESGRWQQPGRGIMVAHSGPLSQEQTMWVAVLWSGPGSALAGLTAAQMDGLSGFASRGIHVLVPASRHLTKERLRVPVVVHRSRLLGAADIHPVRLPPRTRLARSLVDAAAWMASDDRARAVLAAGVQQRLVRADDLMTVAGRCVRVKRRSLITATLTDIAGGAEALSELDFSRLIRRFGIPEPDRQAERRDSQGRRRWLDALWETAKLIVEVDGLWHMDAITWWEDMRRDNEFTVNGYRVLRFPAFAVRYQPEAVARQVRGGPRPGRPAVLTGRARPGGSQPARTRRALPAAAVRARSPSDPACSPGRHLGPVSWLDHEP
jgi:hypothetical protein